MDHGLDGKRRRSLPSGPNKKHCLEASEPSRERCMADVEQAVDKLLDVSESGRQLLRLLVRKSMRICPEERHRFQTLGAELAKEAFHDSQKNLRMTCQKAAEEAEKFQNFTKDRTKELQNATEGFTGAIAAFRSAKTAFLQDNKILQSKRKALDEVEEELHRHRSKLAEVAGCKEELQLAVERHMPAVLQGSSDFLSHAQAVLQLIGRIKLEDSLKNAASSSLKMAPEKRGPFDKATLEQLSGALSALLEAIPSAEAERLAVQDAEAARKAASEAFAEARHSQARSAHCLRLAEIEVREAQSAEGLATESLNDAEQELAKSEGQLKAAGSILKAFEEGPMTSLEVLDRPGPGFDASKSECRKVQDTHDQMSSGVPTPVRSASVL